MRADEDRASAVQTGLTLKEQTAPQASAPACIPFQVIGKGELPGLAHERKRLLFKKLMKNKAIIFN